VAGKELTGAERFKIDSVPVCCEAARLPTFLSGGLVRPDIPTMLGISSRACCTLPWRLHVHLLSGRYIFFENRFGLELYPKEVREAAPEGTTEDIIAFLPDIYRRT
jgi:hypothetical protein